MALLCPNLPSLRAYKCESLKTVLRAKLVSAELKRSLIRKQGKKKKHTKNLKQLLHSPPLGKSNELSWTTQPVPNLAKVLHNFKFLFQDPFQSGWWCLFLPHLNLPGCPEKAFIVMSSFLLKFPCLLGFSHMNRWMSLFPAKEELPPAETTGSLLPALCSVSFGSTYQDMWTKKTHSKTKASGVSLSNRLWRGKELLEKHHWAI